MWLPSFSAADHGKTCRFPLRQPIFKASGTKASLVEDTDRLRSERTVRPAEVRNDLFVARQFAKSSAEFRKGNRDRGRQMACRKCLRGPDIEQDQVFTPLQPPKQLGSRDGFKTVPGTQVGISQLADLGTVLSRHAAQVAPEVEHLRVPQRVEDPVAVPPATDQSHLTKYLQVLTGVGDRKRRLGCQPLDGALAIGDNIDDLQLPALLERLGVTGKLFQQGPLCSVAAPVAGLLVQP